MKDHWKLIVPVLLLALLLCACGDQAQQLIDRFDVNDWITEPVPTETPVPETPAPTLDLTPLPEGIAISEEHFPDENFRAFVQRYDTDGDGSLCDPELEVVGVMYCDDRKIASLQGVEYFTALTELDCRTNKLTELDLSGNPLLVKLWCSDNLLTKLDLCVCPELDWVNCSFNSLQSLDVSGCPLLRELHCYENQLTELDLSGNPILAHLYCHTNRLQQLDLRSNPRLVEVFCAFNELTSLDVTGNSALRSLSCIGNTLKELDLSGCPGLVKNVRDGSHDTYGGSLDISLPADVSGEDVSYWLIVDDTVKLILTP